MSLSVKALVRSRDGNSCVDCGVSGFDYCCRTGRLLDVHRLVPGSPYSVPGCVTVCRSCHKKRHRNLSPGFSGTETIRVPIDLADMIRQICAHYRQVHGRKIKATDYLNQALRERVQRDHAEIMAKVGRKPAP